MSYVTNQEKAHTASLNQSAQEQDELAERRFQLEQSPLYKALVDLCALAEETTAQTARIRGTLSQEEVDMMNLAEAISDQLGGSDAPYAVDFILSAVA
jgi:hypothetical protein